MQIHWSPAAVDDLLHIIEYIQQDNRTAAERVAKAIYEIASSLDSFPYRGRVGRIEGTRELPVPALPFIVIYRVSGENVEIAGIIHGAQRWPPGT